MKEILKKIMTRHSDLSLRREGEDIYILFKNTKIGLWSKNNNNVFYFKVPDDFEDVKKILIPTDYKGMNKYLDISKNRNYIFFVLSIIAMKFEKNDLKKENTFIKDFKAIFDGYLEDLIIDEREWEYLICFVENKKGKASKKFVLDYYLKYLNKEFTKRFELFKRIKEDSSILFTASNNNNEFCRIESGNDPKILFKLDEYNKDYKKNNEGWLYIELRPPLLSIEILFELFEESLGRAVHGKFWNKH